jgi:hypothetical protein
MLHSTSALPSAEKVDLQTSIKPLATKGKFKLNDLQPLLMI